MSQHAATWSIGKVRQWWRLSKCSSWLYERRWIVNNVAWTRWQTNSRPIKRSMLHEVRGKASQRSGHGVDRLGRAGTLIIAWTWVDETLDDGDDSLMSTMGAIKLSEQDQKKPTSWQKSPCTRVSYLRGHDVGMPRLARGKSPDAPEAKQTEMTAVRDITIFWDIPPMHWLALSGPRKSIQVCSGPVCLMSQKKHPKQILALAVV